MRRLLEDSKYELKRCHSSLEEAQAEAAARMTDAAAAGNLAVMAEQVGGWGGGGGQGKEGADEGSKSVGLCCHCF